MTLRLTEEEDLALAATAERLGISKQEAARQAIRMFTDERARFEDIVTRAVDRFGPVLDKLK
ncbi:CopG family transcriptional regulator [Antribacter sp. KLBMP9083]|uniref:CopG family transcriptional regulator n=1 Tax=Antribacter soli TaxID=2910976 RepID=A0AA41QBG3_9MICO|nr:CopG family transcriptional regulator [Antribacter soli]MCF4119526.1 CopG family transcriptional regulator [Antribacter soli]